MPSCPWSAAPTGSVSGRTRRCARACPTCRSGASWSGDPRVRPVALGGNAQVAFYKLRTRPDAYYTMIMTRANARARGAARFVLVTALSAG